MRKIVRRNIFYLASAMSLAGCAVPIVAQESIEVAADAWLPVDASTGIISDVEELEALAQAFPNSSSVRLRLLSAHLAAENRARALAVAEELAAEGYAFSPGAQEFLLGLVRNGPMPQWLATNELNVEPFGESEVVAIIPEEARLPEGLAARGDGHFAVTALVSREVWFSNSVSWEAYPMPEAGNISGLLIDGSGMVIASGDLGMIADETDAYAGLIAIETGNAPVFLEAPAGVQLSDMAFFEDDVVYASDPIGGGVYQIPNVSGEVETLVSPGTLRSPQGIAPSEDGSRLYISDYRYGLAMIGTETGEVSRLASDRPMLLDGIDGLWLHEGELIAVQNGMSPMRIIALRLSVDGDRITSLRVLEQANPEWTEPLGGDIHDGALYYIGNGSWDLFEEGGTLREGAELRPTHIRRLELAENPTD